MKPTWLKKCLWLGLGLVWAAQTLAQSAFPARSLRIVVPTTPGSGSDVTARYFGEQIAAALGVGVVIENRPGGNGIIAAMAVKQAPADGYTLYVRSETPEPVTQKLVETLQKIMATQGTKDYIRSIGSDPLNLQANEMRQFQRSETERFKRIADGAGIRPQ
jgi:tripartite-type tricarboxylate transporter receptor subunit TctC